MAKDAIKNIRLGVFVLAGTAFLIAALYIIGNKKNLFGSTFRVSARFYNVSGLMSGNNVRFAGIDVGTVESIQIMNDSSVNVVMVIEKKIQPFIKKNAIASIGTDGLMGNKLVNINSAGDHAAMAEENDVLQAIKPIEQDEMLRTLNATNENMKMITSNLRTITDRINSKNSLWSILMDTVISENVKASLVNIRLISSQGAVLTGNLKGITEDVRAGKGSLGALIVDSTLYGKLKQVVVKFETVNDSTILILGNISQISKDIKEGKGSAGIFLRDTTFIHNLNKSMENIKAGSHDFDENMKALQQSWPFKKYFKKKNKSKNN